MTDDLEKYDAVEVSDVFYYDGTLAILPGGIAQLASNIIEGMMLKNLALIDWPAEVTHKELPEIHPADKHLDFPHNGVEVTVKFINPNRKKNEEDDHDSED